MIKCFLILTAVTGFIACNKTETPTAADNSEGGDREAAPEFTIETLDHGTFILSQQTGKVVFLYFIGYNCPPCIAAAPLVERDIMQVYDPDQITIAGIDIWDGSVGQLANFKIQTGVTFPLGIQGSAIGTMYGATNDYVVLIDKTGRIAFRQSGVNISVLQENINTLIKE